MRKTAQMRCWEIDHETTLEAVFADLAELSLLQVALKWDIPYTTARQWAERLGVQVAVKREVTFTGASK